MSSTSESLTGSASGGTGNGSADYWSHMDRVSTFKKSEHHHKLTPAQQALMEVYESLDFGTCENDLYFDFQKAELQDGGKETRNRGILKWALFFMIGVCTGTTAFLSAVMVEVLQTWKFEVARGAMPQADAEGQPEGSLLGAYLIDVSICCLFVGTAGFLVVCVEPASAGSGIPEAKAYLNGSNVPRYLSPAALICKAVGVSFAVAGGLCVGKEGPLVHVGSAFAAILCYGWDGAAKHFAKLRNDRDKKDFVSAGCAAGVAAAFGAPIGGVLFSLEEASSFWTVPLLWKVFFSAMVSTFTLNLLLAWSHLRDDASQSDEIKIDDPGLITFGSFGLMSYKTWELPVFCLLGVAGGLIGALFNETNIRLSRWRRVNLGGNKAKLLGEAVFVAWLSATCFFWLPYVTQPFFDACREPDTHRSAHHEEELFQQYGCNDTDYYNEMASLSFTGGEKTIHGLFHSHNHNDEPVFSTAVLCIYLVVYWILAVITYGVKVPSGLFVPGIIVGATFGRLVGETMKTHHWEDEHGTTCTGELDDKVARDYPQEATCEAIFANPAAYPDSAASAAPYSEEACMAGCDFEDGVCYVTGTGERDLGWHLPSENCVFPGTYALIGAASMLGGVTRMTVSLTVILLETTQDIQYLLPIMLVLMLSKWVGDIFNISLYDMHVEFKCIPFVEDLPPSGMEQLVASDVMSTNLVSFAEIEPARDVYQRLCSCKHNGFPVVNAENKILGTILRFHLIRALQVGSFCSADGVLLEGRRALVHDDLQNNLASKGTPVEEIDDAGLDGVYINLQPLMDAWPYVVFEGASLSRVYRLYRGLGVRHLPVINTDNVVVGILSRKELRTDWKGDSLI